MAAPDHYVATAPLDVRTGVRAFNVGDHVPADTVDAHPEWKDDVARPTTAAAKAVDPAPVAKS